MRDYFNILIDLFGLVFIYLLIIYIFGYIVLKARQVYFKIKLNDDFLITGLDIMSIGSSIIYIVLLVILIFKIIVTFL